MSVRGAEQGYDQPAGARRACGALPATRSARAEAPADGDDAEGTVATRARGDLEPGDTEEGAATSSSTNSSTARGGADDDAEEAAATRARGDLELDDAEEAAAQRRGGG